MPPDSALLRDARQRPDLFHWSGPVSTAKLSAWARHHDGVPDDLLSLWAQHGGGDLFESETLLSPLGDPAVGDDVDGATAQQRLQGLPSEWIVFHVGHGTSAFRPSDGVYGWFERRGAAPSRTFRSLDDWYQHTQPAEYADRYGL